MPKKFIKLFILIILLIGLLSLGIFFYLKTKDSGLKQANKISNKYVTELKNKYSQFSKEQINFFKDTASGGSIVPCMGRADESDCILSLAFLLRDDYVCGEIEETKKQVECSYNVLSEKATADIVKCQTVTPDDFKTQCLASIFNIYKSIDDCSIFKDAKTKEVCEAVVNYQIALSQNDIGKCSIIDYEYLNHYCKKIISSSSPDIIKSKTATSTNLLISNGEEKNGSSTTSEADVTDNTKDSDSDGLSDDDETIKYKTDPNNPDTDGDGFNDGSEVKSGHNPNGKI